MSWAAVLGVVAAGVSAYGANRASKKANQRNSTERALEQQMFENSQYSSAYGRRMLDQAEGPLNSSSRFWQAVMNGDRESLMTLYGNDIADLGTQSRTAFQTSQELMPRSGIAAQQLSQMPFNRAIQERRIMSSARPDAANALSTLGTNLASIGTSALNSGQGGASSLLGYGQDRRAYAGQVGSDTGAALYSLIKMFGDNYASGRSNRNSGGSSWWGGATTPRSGSGSGNSPSASGTYW